VVLRSGKLDVAATLDTPAMDRSWSVSDREAATTASGFGYLGPR